MEYLKLAETDTYSLEINSPLSLVYLVFKKHISNGELRQTILKAIDVAQKYHSKHIMINSHHLDYVEMSDQHWLATEFPCLVATMPDHEMVPRRKIIGILPEESTRLLVGYTIIEKAQKFLKESRQVEIVIYTSLNAALLSIEPS
ncbi:hypothetical protein AHMF7605_10185 [Adhaeribacter arboris]|uniref:Uncharacterized protein n=1 Tax=Adhaeribacter arboris TaxID=2072846 RepID=A0A2T2YEC1_9BACT|nr:hypothetical protein [Adhaeribacter arboris]PSR53861.1 hypothetical protein AHMF7605_10185 [Adhaeribacter arboris]